MDRLSPPVEAIEGCQIIEGCGKETMNKIIDNMVLTGHAACMVTGDGKLKQVDIRKVHEY